MVRPGVQMRNPSFGGRFQDSNHVGRRLHLNLLLGAAVPDPSPCKGEGGAKGAGRGARLSASTGSVVEAEGAERVARMGGCARARPGAWASGSALGRVL